MNIGIDVDGVLTDIHSFNLRHAPPFFKKRFNREVIDDSKLDIRDVFACPDEELSKYWRKHKFAYTVFIPARKRARKTVRALRKDGHKVYIISKRVFTCRKGFVGKFMRSTLRTWLWRKGIRYSEIIFCDSEIADSKKTACLAKDIDIMVDDEPVNIEAIAPIAKVICFDTSYNRECVGDNIKRAQNWDEVYRIINNNK